ncbi:hypothetical protein G6F37_005780 [Rhizopus arrhizus]|nr:hypothetical protein G6F38_000320 [Rhizopus arrhizus]KAG1158457.1 hypothetical protein G6F37_005780 [Rhizopus arrhizus]
MERKSRSSRLANEEMTEVNIWKQICSSLIKLEGIQKDEQVVLNNINNVQYSIQLEKGISGLIHQKLKDNYRRGIELSSNETKNDEWILAVVVQYYPDRNKYQVEDVDEDGGKQYHMLSPKYLIPVPTPKEAENAPEIPANQDVLALYPGTTCFYKAIVISPPNKSKDIKNYRVQFEDDNNQVKQVAPEHVLEMPQLS